MKVFFLGNCQVNAMRGLCREMFPSLKASFQTITPYWGQFDEDATRQELAEADLVVSQAIANPTTTFNVDDVRSSAQGDVVFVPYVYIDGIASLEIIASKGKSVIRGAEQLLRGQEGRKPVKIFNDYCEGVIDMECEARVLGSIARIAEKEAADCDITISDYLDKTWRKQPTLYGMNHPTQAVVFEMFKRLCEKVGWDYDEDHQNDPIAWGRRALPASQRGFTPNDAKTLGLEYDCDTHWYGNSYKLLQLALKAQENAQRDADAA
ncbi:MAG: hypothetical protein KC439_12640 [Yoonia sp.]|nr:hypothetical protein [Yoonia sp.]